MSEGQTGSSYGSWRSVVIIIIEQLAIDICFRPLCGSVLRIKDLYNKLTHEKILSTLILGDPEH